MLFEMPSTLRALEVFASNEDEVRDILNDSDAERMFSRLYELCMRKASRFPPEKRSKVVEEVLVKSPEIRECCAAQAS